ncbi:FecR family protein [Saccharicrinis aurantiacus]|uniref:FecR family protein n=1 Tax=Saccharicrinis aurantiacus TaxID=1849719 RepID=UPI000838F7F4|nr:FecR domain-containing protein [Saccharicrinis aurantiacus]
MKDYFKILSRKANDEERKAFFTELQNNEEAKEEFIDAQALWTLSNIQTKQASKKHKQEAFNKFWSATHGATKLSLQAFVKYAAVFVLAIGISILFQYSIGLFNKAPNYTYQSQKGGVTEFTLADGTSIWLNSDSKIEVYESNKEVTANLDGEAFFNVIHNPDRAFIVNAGGVTIEDLGTQFNVSAYGVNSLVKTTLLEGSIDLFDVNGQAMKAIVPGQIAFYHKAKNKMWIKEADIDAVTAWKEGKFAFIDKTLGTICSELEKWYDVDIHIADKALAKTKYSCMLKRPTTVKQVLEIFKKTSNINFKIETTAEGKEEVIIMAIGN